MINYIEMKHSDNGIPTWDAFLGPVLTVANNKDTWKAKDLINATMKAIGLPKELAKLNHSNSECILQNRSTQLCNIIIHSCVMKKAIV